MLLILHYLLHLHNDCYRILHLFSYMVKLHFCNLLRFPIQLTVLLTPFHLYTRINFFDYPVHHKATLGSLLSSDFYLMHSMSRMHFYPAYLLYEVKYQAGYNKHHLHLHKFSHVFLLHVHT